MFFLLLWVYAYSMKWLFRIYWFWLFKMKRADCVLYRHWICNSPMKVQFEWHCSSEFPIILRISTLKSCWKCVAHVAFLLLLVIFVKFFVLQIDQIQKRTRLNKWMDLIFELHFVYIRIQRNPFKWVSLQKIIYWRDNFR